MGVLSWILIGALMGLLVNRLIAGRFPGGLLGAIVGGTLGAALGGLLFSAVLGRGVVGFDPASLLIAFAGAAGLLTVLRLAGRAEPEPVSTRGRERGDEPDACVGA